MPESGGNNLFQIAQVLKSNGIDGELLLSFRDIDPSDIDIQEPVFIFFDGLPVPFFIESLIPRGSNKALARLNDTSSLKDAEELVGKAVFADSKNYDCEVYGDSDLTGWTLLDKNGEKCATISGYEDIPGNPCIIVDTENGQAMIPLHEDLVLSVDEQHRELQMDIPEGLL